MAFWINPPICLTASRVGISTPSIQPLLPGPQAVPSLFLQAMMATLVASVRRLASVATPKPACFF
jgi:hypothetical protein